MPRRSSRKVGRRQRGKGILSFLGRVNNFLRKSKLVSTVGSALGSAGVPYASKIGSLASSVGYGRRSRKGGGLNLAGGSMRRRR